MGASARQITRLECFHLPPCGVHWTSLHAASYTCLTMCTFGVFCGLSFSYILMTHATAPRSARTLVQARPTMSCIHLVRTSTRTYGHTLQDPHCSLMCQRVCTPCIFPSNYMEWYFPPLIKTFTKVWEAAYCTTHTAETTSGEIQTIFDLKWIETTRQQWWCYFLPFSHLRSSVGRGQR